MKKMSFPRITLPTIVVGSCSLNNVLLFISMTGIFAILGQQFSTIMLWLIPLTLIVIILVLGIGLILGVMNVFLRDVGQVFPIILQIWLWFTPIVYPENIIPESYRHLLIYNPMYPIILFTAKNTSIQSQQLFYIQYVIECKQCIFQRKQYINAYHQVLVFNKMPDIDSLITVTAIATALALFGLFLFRRASAEMVDVL